MDTKDKNIEASSSQNRDVDGDPPQITPTDTSRETGNPPRFLIVKRIEGDFARVNPFTIEKNLYGVIGNAKNISKIREGLLVETVSAAQSRCLLKAKKIGEFAVEVVPHNNLNTSRGVIYCQDLLNCSIDEILEGLKDQGVLAVRRIKIKRDGNLIDSPNHIITFNNPVLPKRIKVAFYSLPVRLYVPPPMRCFKCQKFGHTSLRCQEEQICICGKPLHVGSPCEEPLTCINCNGSHSARSRNCPIYKQETAIQEIKVKENISYFEAKKRILINTPTPNVSYAKATSSPPKSDYTSLVDQLIPKIVAAILPLIKQDPPSQTSNIDSEKRKREMSPDFVSLLQEMRLP
ncbi:uncharacterized protein LOC108915146 [Anoplophora glabripennis]|uniref:uncharacterized protein LOC108915146 n=1 Tax=Anoplophora glabripennis TaxID=217634 RepID=UPI00087477C3|nr:uncharacterized protein LOC108915146 [Anoplophora glabripennis]